MSTVITQNTLAQVLWPGGNAMVRNIVFAVGASIALWISAKIHVPFWPVPLTMQTFAVLVIGMAFGWRLGSAAVLLYLAEGALGLPVFSGTPEKGIGLAYLMGPTGGYLLGYAVAAAAVGKLAERGWDRNFLTTALAMLAGNAIIYVFGLLWLGAVIGWDKPVLEFGLYPFILGDVLKLALAALLLPATWRFMRRMSR